jgi:hypothetical protein
MAITDILHTQSQAIDLNWGAQQSSLRGGGGKGMAKILLKVPARANLSHNETQFPPEIKHISAQNQSERREDPTTATLSPPIPPPEITGFKNILFSRIFHQLRYATLSPTPPPPLLFLAVMNNTN